MIALIVILCIAVLIALLLQIRIGAEVEYSEAGFSAAVKVLGRSITVFPRPKKTRTQREKAAEKSRKKQEKKQRKAAKKAEKQRRKAGKKASKPKEPKPKKKGGTVELVLALLPVALQALGALKHRLRIDPLIVHFTAGSEDAADTAILYGRSSGAAGIVVALLEEHFDVRNREVTVGMDFLSGQSVIYIRAGISIKIGQVLYLAVRYGFACLRVWLAQKQAKKNAKAKDGPDTAAGDRSA